MSITHDQIQAALRHLEGEESAKVLVACESGSRAWGFESTDSDYDVRFIYLRPARWYLTIDAGRDVIERPISDALDLSGWDLRKALQLFRKSNPPLMEWLRSPIVYAESGSAASRLRAMMKDHYSPTSCIHHYLSMASGNNRQYLKGETVSLKKYFYVLRPLLACRWLEEGLGVVPMEFSVLLDRLVPQGALRDAILQLLKRKRAGEELDRGPRIAVISDFLDGEIARISQVEFPRAAVCPTHALDNFFLEMLHEYYGDRI
jgi:predicted nucleotidyltransferase